MARHKQLYIGSPSLVYRVCTSAITANVGPNCANPMVNGVDMILRLINTNDIEGYVDDGTTPVIKTAITLATGKKFFKYEGTKTGNNAKMETIEKPIGTYYSHQVEMVVRNAGGLTITQLEALVASGRQNGITALVKYVWKGTAGETAYEIHGADQGMTCLVTRDQADGDSGGAFKITLKTDPKFLEPHMPAPLFDTDLATTDAKVDTYTTT